MSDESISILIVEDEPPVRSLLAEIVSQRFSCLTAESAAEALGLMESRFFHLALVDIGLPGMSGLGLIRLIVNKSPGTIVVVVSGAADDQSVADALKAGAVDFITKPFDLAHAIATVERALGRDLPGALASN